MLNFINLLFYKVLYMSIIGIFVGIFILIFRKCFDKKISPKWKCIIWILLLISLLVPIKIEFQTQNSNMEVLSISGLIEPIQNISGNSYTSENEELKSIEKNAEIKSEISEIKENNPTKKNDIDIKSTILYKIIPSAWIIGSMIYMLLLFLGNNNIKKKIKRKEYQNENIKKILEQCKDIIGVKTDVKIVLQDFKKTPSIIGIFNPKILITKDFLEQDYNTQKYIIMHELSHYKRKDLILNYILLFITTIHWFNPFIWLFFKKIRQDMELATDEIVLEKLESNEKKEYGMTLINALETFQEEKQTAKLLCVTDDNKNIERRIKMIKLSDKFSKNKIIIAIISTIIILVGVCLFFTKEVDIEENNTQTANNEITQKYEYKSFKPTFKTSPESTGDDYDFTQDMIYRDGIYYKKLNDYEEYSKVKSRWNDILDMTKSDFENNFMVITAIENTSMLGLTVDKIETDNNNLYISLIHYEDGAEYNENETCISYIISRDMERENINVTRNLRQNEKDMSAELKIAERNDLSSNDTFTYQYKDEEYRKVEQKLSENPNSQFSLVPQDWKDMMYKKFTITTDMPDIDFSNWNDLGNDFYSIAITDHSEYLKMINNYQAPQMSWRNFKYVYAIIIVRASSDNTIDVEDIKTENGQAYLNVVPSGWLDVAEGFKYPAICVYVPNYKSLAPNYLQVRAK